MSLAKPRASPAHRGWSRAQDDLGAAAPLQRADCTSHTHSSVGPGWERWLLQITDRHPLKKQELPWLTAAKSKISMASHAAQGRTSSRTAQQQLPQLLPAAREAQEERGLSPASRDCCSCELPFPMASFGPEPRFHSTHTAASSGSALPAAAGMPAARTQPL